MKKRKLPALLLSLLLPLQSSWTNVALAQSAPPSASALADVVKLKDGSMYRGTIVELVPGDHVDLVLPSGQTRRFQMSDVAYAGAATHEEVPAAASPSAPPPVPAPSAVDERTPKADLHLEANEADVQFLVRIGQGEASGFGYAWGGGGGFVSFVGHSREYALICTAPCDGELPNGIHRLALSLRGGKASRPKIRWSCGARRPFMGPTSLAPARAPSGGCSSG